jgi:hypothetical protein
MEKAILIIVIFVLIFVIGLLILCSITYVKVKNLQQGSCVGVPKFDPNSIYTKTMTIPIIGYKMVGKATFKPDNTFILDFGSSDIYNNNKWIYNSDSCSLTVSIDNNLQNILSQYNSSIDNTIQINRLGQLIVNGTVEGVIPVQVTLNKN